MQEDCFGKHIFAFKLPSKQKSTALNPKSIPKENLETQKATRLYRKLAVPAKVRKIEPPLMQ